MITARHSNVELTSLQTSGGRTRILQEPISSRILKRFYNKGSGEIFVQYARRSWEEVRVSNLTARIIRLFPCGPGPGQWIPGDIGLKGQ